MKFNDITNLFPSDGSAQDDDYSTLSQYIIDFTFALVVSTVLGNLFLMCRIQFRREIQVTKLTFQPYIFALAFLSVQLLECLTILISQVMSDLDPTAVIVQHFFSRYTIALLSVKFVLFYVFVLTQTLENWLLSLFMTIQSSVTLAELDIVKQRYKNQEKNMYQLFKARIYFVAVSQLVISILPFFRSIDMFVIVLAQMSTFIATLVLCMQEYFFGATTFIGIMYHEHRYEFRRHAFQLVILSAAILCSLLSSLFGFYFISVVVGCLLTQTTMGLEQSVDECLGIFSVGMNADLSAKLYFWFIVFEMVPFIFFFILNRPHDCFMCLGKDPDRRFSVFQLTKEELQQREHQVKYGYGGFNIDGTIATTRNSATARNSATQIDSSETQRLSQKRLNPSLSIVNRRMCKKHSTGTLLNLKRPSKLIQAPSPSSFDSQSPVDSILASNAMDGRYKRTLSWNIVDRNEQLNNHEALEDSYSFDDKQLGNCRREQYSHSPIEIQHRKLSDYDSNLVPKSLENSYNKKSLLRQVTGFERIEETDNDHTDSINDPVSSRNAEHLLVMTSVENASLMYKMAGTIISSRQASRVSSSNNTKSFT